MQNAKFFTNHKVHCAALISVSLAFSQTPVYTARSRIRRFVCVPPFAGTHCAYPCREGRPDWVHLGGWLHTDMGYPPAVQVL